MTSVSCFLEAVCYLAPVSVIDVFNKSQICILLILDFDVLRVLLCSSILPLLLYVDIFLILVVKVCILDSLVVERFIQLSLLFVIKDLREIVDQ